MKKTKDKSLTKTQVSRSGDQVLEKAEETSLFLRTAGTCKLRSRCHSHWADNILIPHLGELVVVMQTGDTELLARVDIGMGERESNTIYRAELVEHGLVLLCPLAVDRIPFINGELIDVRGHTVVFASADKVLGKVATRNVPVSPQLLEMAEVTNYGFIRLRHDSEIGVAEFVGPFIIGIGEDEGRYIA